MKSPSLPLYQEGVTGAGGVSTAGPSSFHSVHDVSSHLSHERKVGYGFSHRILVGFEMDLVWKRP